MFTRHFRTSAIGIELIRPIWAQERGRDGEKKKQEKQELDLQPIEKKKQQQKQKLDP